MKESTVADLKQWAKILLFVAAVFIPLFSIIMYVADKRTAECIAKGGHQYQIGMKAVCLTPDGRIME